MNDLDARILDAHDRGDRAGLVVLYTRAADLARTPDAAAFFLTQAYVFALETGHEQTPALRARLVGMGREETPAPDAHQIAWR